MKIGDIVKITFFDHCLRSEDIFEVVVFGEIHKLDKLKVVIVFWESVNLNYDNNNEYMSIVRTTIKKIEYLKVYKIKKRLLSIKN